MIVLSAAPPLIQQAKKAGKSNKPLPLVPEQDRIGWASNPTPEARPGAKTGESIFFVEMIITEIKQMALTISLEEDFATL